LAARYLRRVDYSVKKFVDHRYGEEEKAGRLAYKPVEGALCFLLITGHVCLIKVSSFVDCC
jgi:hypothetical protein